MSLSATANGTTDASSAAIALANGGYSWLAGYPPNIAPDQPPGRMDAGFVMSIQMPTACPVESVPMGKLSVSRYVGASPRSTTRHEASTTASSATSAISGTGGVAGERGCASACASTEGRGPTGLGMRVTEQP